MIDYGDMDAEGAEGALMFAIAQIVSGEAYCHCGARAVFTVANGADPEPEPVCFDHGMEWMTLTAKIAGDLFGPKAAQDAVTT